MMGKTIKRGKTVRLITSVLDFPGIWAGKLSAWLIVPMVGVLVYGVITRYIFDAPSIWTYDITYMLYGSIFMLGAAYTLARDAHVRADFLYSNLPARWQGAIDAAFYILLYFPSIAIFTWLSLQFALDSWEQGERMPSSPWLPIIYPYKSVMPATGVLLLIQGVSELVKSLYCVVTNEPFRQPGN